MKETTTVYLDIDCHDSKKYLKYAEVLRRAGYLVSTNHIAFGEDCGDGLPELHIGDQCYQHNEIPEFLNSLKNRNEQPK